MDATHGFDRGLSPLRLLWLALPRIAGSFPGGWPQNAQRIKGEAGIGVAPIGASTRLAERAEGEGGGSELCVGNQWLRGMGFGPPPPGRRAPATPDRLNSN